MSVKIVGIEAISGQLKENITMDMVKAVVQKHGDQLNQRMKRQTTSAFVKGYTTGQTARSINTTMTDDGLTATVEPTTDYAAYVEYGTRFMQAEPFVRPAFDAQKKLFKNDMKRLVK